MVDRGAFRVRVRDGRPQEDPLAVHYFCVCSGSALLGYLKVSRFMECDLSVLSIYPRIFLLVGLSIVFRLFIRDSILFALLYSTMFMCFVVWV